MFGQRDKLPHTHGTYARTHEHRQYSRTQRKAESNRENRVRVKRGQGRSCLALISTSCLRPVWSLINWSHILIPVMLMNFFIFYFFFTAAIYLWCIRRGLCFSVYYHQPRSCLLYANEGNVMCHFPKISAFLRKHTHTLARHSATVLSSSWLNYL